MGHKEARQITAEDIKILMDSGKNQKEIAKELGVSVPTIARRMAALRLNKGPPMQFRDIKGLCLNSIQASALEAITPERIEKASLLELMKAYKVLLKSDKPLRKVKGEFTGLLNHLPPEEDG
ncbi:winged helix-turn-helix transcriptional regulator [Solidesulfovibrio magneticus]|uniref:Uncharacterized protein n=1 Tax=Solidesulfovibrio magneticus (strain ATCC 700980 / DSM 13731 / RS-1) TaxID=573370 RepID=C4XQJ1_SOLM1|nr:winged helix-turn-helix transcriptional regulator [Solidesulfovibrio magneticus]BAH75356.1 hypothetical protein DMR_18650 [Solidesulfovibrio magneticus RS-1]